MNTRDFYARVTADIRRELAAGRIKLERIHEIATAALEFGKAYPKGLEREDLQAFAARFPEFRFEMMKELRAEERKADEVATEELRKLIKKD